MRKIIIKKDEFMGITERRKLEKEIIRKIIDTANQILVEEGYENLSIRKIANKIEYSPGIIYHYFKDKSEIVTFVVEQGYGRILKSINEVPVDTENPEKTIEQGLRKYIELMLQYPEQFRTVLMNDIKSIQEKVNMLHEGVSKDRKSIQQLCRLVELGIQKGKFRDMDIELTAQIIWTSTHGLLSRLILEKYIKAAKGKTYRSSFSDSYKWIVKIKGRIKMKTLIVYGTKHGTTEKCSKFLKDKLSGEVVIINIKKENMPDITTFNNIIIGGSIYMGQIQKEVKIFV